MERWQVVRELAPSDQSFTCGALSPDGRWAVAGVGRWYADEIVALYIWDARTGALERQITLQLPCVWSVAFHPT
ncbi:WD40 repeat domain-containing protein [Hyalangium versicolor]|uniref:WD40 repeat domain-containing protein n=1 Tax=Hyalangium versicolor TaxID=2861190 RepID=UPI001CCD0ED7|nr:WD40 repeat domain-containing protein [Hyalangium versicolor]